MDKTRDFILEGLSRYSLANLPGRPYDSAFEVMASSPSRKRIIVMGFNGSLADSHMTNSQSIIQDHSAPLVSNVHLGSQGQWGITRLATRLKQIPIQLGYNWEDVIYTNAIMMCSLNAGSLRNEALQFNMSIKDIITNSMLFFENVTLPLSEPEIIIAYSNSLQSISAASILLNHFGNTDTLKYSCPNGYHTTFAFHIEVSGRRIPVICVRHMSRFKPNENLIKVAHALITGKPDV